MPPAPRRQPKGVQNESKQQHWAQLLEQAFGRRTRAPSSRLLGRRLGGPVAASAPAPATDLGWRSGAPCTRTPAKGCAQEGQAAALGAAPGTSVWLAHQGP